MKKILFLVIISIGITIFDSCLRVKDTYAYVTVVDENGKNVGAGITVHMQLNSPETLLGNSPNSAEISMTTNQKGVAEFMIKPGYFLDYGYDVITRHFVVFKEIDKEFLKYEVIGNISANIDYGSKKELTLTLKK